MNRITILKVLTILSLLPLSMLAQLSVTANSAANTLAQTIAGTGVTVTNASLSCGSQGSGLFTYTGTHLGMPNGIILTTGHAVDAANSQGYSASVNNGGGHNDPNGLGTITTGNLNDLCALSFDFVPLCNSLSITYVFASEEYPNYVGSTYNDAFGIFLTGPNPSGGNYTSANIGALPTVPPTPVSINNVNASANSSYFVPNYTNNYNDIAYGGFTIPVTSTKPVTPCQTYHLEISIADVSDGVLDSGVFVEGDAVSCQTAPAASVASTSVACGNSNGTAAVTVTNYSGTATYSWMPGGQTTSSISGLSAGNYTCLVTFTTTCSGSTTQTLVTTVDAPASNFSVTANSSPASCPTTADGSATVTISGGTQPYNITWATNPVQTNTVATSLPAGTYSVNVSDANGCSLNASTTVDVLNQPNVTATNTTVCGNVYVLNSIAGTNYQWYDTSGVAIAGATSQSYSATTLNNGQNWGVSYINTSTGCRDTMVISINQVNLHFSSVISPACGGGNTGALNLTSTGSYTLSSYDWNLTGVTSASGTNVPAPISASNLPAGQYTVIVTQPGSTTCYYADTLTVPSNGIAPATPTPIKVCNMDTLRFNPSLPSGSTNTWYMGTSTLSIGTSAANTTFTIAPVQVDGTTYTDTIRSSAGCKSVLKYFVTVQSFTATGSIVKKPKCHNDSIGEIKLTVPRETNGPINQPYTFTWEYPSPETSPSPVHAGSTVPVTSTEYSLHAGSTYTCIVTAGNCAYTYTYTFINPDALLPDSIYGYYCPKDSLAQLVADTGIKVTNYQWYNNGTFISGANTYSLEVVTQDISNYYVKYLRSGCIDSAKVIIPVTTNRFFVPNELVNVFSPNNDKKNDYFYPFYQDNMSQYEIYKQTQSYELKIYNRWGILVYETSDYNKAWNGKINGNGAEADAGTYFYIAKFQSNCGNLADVVEKKGFLELVR